MTKKKNEDMRILKYVLCAVLGVLLLPGCDKWLEVQPYDQMAEGDLLGKEEGFRKLLNGIYVDLNKDELYGQTLTVEMVEIMACSYLIGTDALTWGNYIDLDNRNFESEYWRTRLDNTWNTAYALIRNCNTILEQMAGKESLFTGNDYNLIRGEALALRALLHFDMFRLFGPVYKVNPEKESIPYVTTTALQVQELLPGTEVMRHVVEDLEEAERLLEEDPIRTTTDHLVNHATVEGDNFWEYRTLRLNYYAVQALLARAYYYMASHAGDRQADYKAKAEAYARGVIDIAPVHFPFVDKANVLGNPENVDRIFATEVIFGLTNVNRNLMFQNNNDPDHSPQPVLRMDPVLLEAPYFGGGSEYGGSTDDYRYIANWRKNGNDYYFYKYADMADVSRIENTIVPMVRLGEMYIILADLHNDERPVMAGWVNQLRAHRGVELMPETEDYRPSMLDYEAVRELYGEGQLFYYYKRNYTGILTVFESPSQFREASEKFYVVPLPDTETENRQ